MVSASDSLALTFSRSAGQASDSVAGRKLLPEWKSNPQQIPWAMDKAYKGEEARQLVLTLGLLSGVTPKSNWIVEPWEYGKALYKRRNEDASAYSLPSKPDNQTVTFEHQFVNYSCLIVFITICFILSFVPTALHTPTF